MPGIGEEPEIDRVVKAMLSEVEEPGAWGVYEFPWGAGIKYEPSGRWHQVLLKPDGRMLDISDLSVELHDNGIEFY